MSSETVADKIKVKMLKLVWFFTLVVTARGANETGSIPHLDGRIVGGDTTTIDKHPYQVSVQFRRSHHCGGSIISNDTILTAAHCLAERTSDYTVRVGSTTTTGGGEVYSATRVIVHRSYNKDTFDYDIGLIQVDRNISVSSNVQTITLAKMNEAVANGTIANTTGWGYTTEGGSVPQNLRVVSVPVIANTQCAKSYENGGSVTNRMICAGEAGKDACQGDSGGPLVVNGTQIGIVSWGYGCARPGYPGVYTRVAALRDWIDRNDAAKLGGIGQTTFYFSILFTLISKLNLLFN